jgi:hypothetical protein
VAHGREQEGDLLLVMAHIARLVHVTDKEGSGLSGDGAASAPAINLGHTSEREFVGRASLRYSGSRLQLIGSH